MDLYLITGFLGAGKTTFLKEFVGLFPHQKLYLIINEFGKVGVDGTLLRELGATLAQINNGSIFCSCRLDQFEAALDQATEAAPEVVLVEASGLSDPTNIRGILGADKYSGISYRGSVCLVDPATFGKVVHTARMCRKQVAASSLALINKTDLASPEALAETERLLREISPGLSIRFTSYGKFDPQWLDLIQPCRAEQAENRPDLTLQKACVVLKLGMEKKQLMGLLALLADDTHRIKGFVELAEGVCLVDCVSSCQQVVPYEGAVEAGARNRLVMLAGQGMALRRRLKEIREWYGPYIEEITFG